MRNGVVKNKGDLGEKQLREASSITTQTKQQSSQKF